MTEKMYISQQVPFVHQNHDNTINKEKEMCTQIELLLTKNKTCVHK